MCECVCEREKTEQKDKPSCDHRQSAYTLTVNAFTKRKLGGWRRCDAGNVSPMHTVICTLLCLNTSEDEIIIIYLFCFENAVNKKSPVKTLKRLKKKKKTHSNLNVNVLK